LTVPGRPHPRRLRCRGQHRPRGWVQPIALAKHGASRVSDLPVERATQPAFCQALTHVLADVKHQPAARARAAPPPVHPHGTHPTGGTCRWARHGDAVSAAHTPRATVRCGDALERTRHLLYRQRRALRCLRHRVDRGRSNGSGRRERTAIRKLTRARAQQKRRTPVGTRRRGEMPACSRMNASTTRTSAGARRT
jgi:hypothetical protein